MVTAHKRGHPIYWDHERKVWLYADDHSPITAERACVKCKLMPTEDGYDPCLGHIPGAVSACCGHGVSPAYVIFHDQTNVPPDGLPDGYCSVSRARHL
jgi:hypothetical protein